MLNYTTIGVHAFYTFLLVFSRTSGLIAVAPVLGSRSIPHPLKAGLALVLSLAIMPLQEAHTANAPTHLLVLTTQIAGEAILGIVMGYIARLFFSAVEIAGTLVDTQMGFGFLQLANPFAEQPNSILSVFQYQLATTLYLLMNGHLLLIGAMVESFTLITPGTFAPTAAFGGGFATILQGVMLLCIRVALPAIGVLILMEIAFGIMARLVPTLNVFFVGAPAKIIVGLTTVSLLLPAFAMMVGQVMTESMQGIHQLLSAGK
ncbi:MAG: flagellar biosynthetic protein FliR [Armatimonadetes bacterium]|nr:flagellar biosynthetic protein FliR [Armatimonadota bacterium]